MWFRLQPAGLEFIAGAPFRFDVVSVLPALPPRAFEAFAEPRQMARFIEGFRACAWKTSGPHGVGSARQLDLWGISFWEHFLAWETGRRLCFAIDALTLPAMRRMVEDIRIEPWGRGQSRLIWSVHYDPAPLTRMAHPFVRFGVELGYRRSVERLGRMLFRDSTKQRSTHDGQAA